MSPVATSTARPSSTRHPAGPAAHQRRGRPAKQKSDGVAGYVFLSPWLLGLLTITAVPMLMSLYLSFTNYDVLSDWESMEWVGLENYRTMFTEDPSFWHAVQTTLVFALVATPLKLAAALGVALLLNRPFKGAGLFRGLFYLPSLLGGSVALAQDGPFLTIVERRESSDPAGPVARRRDPGRGRGVGGRSRRTDPRGATSRGGAGPCGPC